MKLSRLRFGLSALLLMAVALPHSTFAQAPSQQLPNQAPTLIPVTGELKTATGQPRTGDVLLVLSLYAKQDDTTPLSVEQQLVTLDQSGRYAVWAGATLPDGLPQELFLSNAPRWLGVAVQGEPEHARIILIAVPYALKAREADTLTGKQASDFVLSSDLGTNVKDALKAAGVSGTTPGALAAANRVPKFVDSGASLTDSSIFDNGFVGIGNTSPVVSLDVTGSAHFSGLTGAGIRLQPNGTAGELLGINHDNNAFNSLQFRTSGMPALFIASNNYVGVGNTVPVVSLEVTGSGHFSALTGPGIRLQPNGSAGEIQGINHSNNAFNALQFTTSGVASMFIGTNGNVGIGNTNPTQKLDVAGSINVSGNINAKYQDVAEWVETSVRLEPGTVVIVDPLHVNQVLPTRRAYDTRVAGAVSLQPGVLLGERTETAAMIAQSGRVRVKADAKYGAIRIGDLLVTSPTEGYAMRSRPMRVGGQSLHRPGTLLGKALEALANGQGEILVLLTLQ